MEDNKISQFIQALAFFELELEEGKRTTWL